MLSDKELDEIEARVAKATIGPWLYFGWPHDSPFWGEIRSAADEGCFAHITDTPDLDERDNDMEFIAHAREDVPALLLTARELKEQVATLTAQWCECGHAKTRHSFFSDHDECYECDQASPDLCCEWRPAPAKQA